MRQKRNRFIALAALLLLTAAPAAPQEAEKKLTLKGSSLSLPAPVRFAPEGDRLTPDSEKTLALVADFLKGRQSVTLLRVEGHVGGGEAEGAQKLSEQRALAVARWLAEHGVACKRLVAVGFGATKPAAENESPDGRVEFTLAALNHRLLGGLPADGGGQSAGEVCQE